MAAQVLSIHGSGEQQICCCGMNNPLTNEEMNPESGEDSLQIFKVASKLALAFVLSLGLVFVLKGGFVLLLFLLMGNYCC